MRPAAGADDVRDYRRQLDVGVLQRFLNPLNMLGDFACQLRSRPRQITHILNLRWRHEARPYQAVGEQIRNPHRVVDVALATRNTANVRSIREHQLEPALQDVPDRLPVDASGLHRYARDPLRRQPIRELQQIPRCR
jgi:hypothetical protein